MRLEPMREADITPEYLSWLNDKSLMRYSRQRLVDHTRQTALRYLASFADSPNHFWGLWAEGRMVGTATGYHDLHTNVMDVGFLVGYPGFGYGRRACEAILKTTTARRVTGGTVAENEAMVKIFERCGFFREGRLRQHEQIGETLCDVLLYGLLT